MRKVRLAVGNFYKIPVFNRTYVGNFGQVAVGFNPLPESNGSVNNFAVCKRCAIVNAAFGSRCNRYGALFNGKRAVIVLNFVVSRYVPVVAVGNCADKSVYNRARFRYGGLNRAVGDSRLVPRYQPRRALYPAAFELNARVGYFRRLRGDCYRPRRDCRRAACKRYLEVAGNRRF